LEKEALTRQQNKQEPSPSFEDLSPGLLEKISSLEKFPFADEESEELFEHWKSRKQDILDVMDFYSQWGEQFKGKQYLDFDEALELIKRFKALEETMQQIASGKWRSVDLETLKELLVMMQHNHLRFLCRFRMSFQSKASSSLERRALT